MIVLGLSGGLNHDAAACIVRDGELIAYAEEERFVRSKHAKSKEPICSTLFCLQQAGLTIEEVDIIAPSWLPDEMAHWNILGKYLDHPIFREKKKPQAIPVNHHISHAASSYYCSGFDEATILVIDGQGEHVSTTLAHGKKDNISILRDWGVSQSIGFFYRIISEYLQLGSMSEGKLMGLACYGEPVYEFPIKFTQDGYEMDIAEPMGVPIGLQYGEVQKQWKQILNRMFSLSTKASYGIDFARGGLQTYIEYNEMEKNIAASAQHALETAIQHLIKYAVATTGCKNVVITGGVGLNCTNNGKLERSGLLDGLFVLPATSDSGGCIGAALVVSKQMGGGLKRERLRKPYWGPSFTNAQIHEVIIENGLKSVYFEDIARKSAELLVKNKVIGWFQGEEEMGPRALGNRSIIANPTIRSSYDQVNRRVKFREPWRPLAPSVLDEKKDWLVEQAQYSPYMLKAYQVREEVKSIVPAIVHVDGSARPQTVTQDDNELWYSLISNFHEHTGIPLILNTSLNVKGEPVCGTPVDAIQTFYSSAMDVLVLGNFILTK
jgi:carbamoyltransferase